jgi:hypothetical protein
MSRKVIIKALLPHRDTISTMTVSPRLLRAELYISGLYECMPQVSNSVKKPAFCSVMSGLRAGELHHPITVWRLQLREWCSRGLC